MDFVVHPETVNRRIAVLKERRLGRVAYRQCATGGEKQNSDEFACCDDPGKSFPSLQIQPACDSVATL
jgi:hypothetical protein